MAPAGLLFLAILGRASGDLFSSAAEGDLKGIRAAIVQHSRGVHSRVDESVNGETALHIASVYGHVDAVRLLLESGAAIGSRGSDGNTPLHLAAATDQLDVATVLLDHGASFDVQSDLGYTPLRSAVQFGKDIGVVNALISAGASPEVPDDDGSTPLHVAAALGKLDCAT